MSPLDDALPEDQNQDEAAPPPPPEPPQIDEEAAIQIVANKYGWDPRVADYEIREFGQRKAQLDRKERELAALEERVRRSNSFETPPGYEQDPTFRTVAELAREMREDREERRREREERVNAERLTRDLTTSYQSLMARVPNKVEQGAFFNAMLEVYPDQSLLERVGIDRATSIVYRYMQSNGSGGYSAPRTTPSRREPIIIPGGTAGGAGPPAGMADLTPPARNANESEDSYRQRYNAWAQQFSPGMGGLKDGQRVSSG